MLVQDIIDLSKARLGNVAIARNESVLVKYIYLGVSELYRYFNLSIKSEVIETNVSKALYELDNSDVSLLLSVYDIDGRELRSSDVVESNNWEMKVINYKSFLLNNPQNGFVYAIYKASPAMFMDTLDTIDIPDVMVNALLCYVTYMVFSTVGSASTVNSGNNSSISYYQLFKEACQELEMEGYKIPLNAETLSVIARGYK